MVWKKILFEVLKIAAMVAQHNDSAGCKSTNTQSNALTTKALRSTNM